MKKIMNLWMMIYENLWMNNAKVLYGLNVAFVISINKIVKCFLTYENHDSWFKELFYGDLSLDW